tara:strand:- start:6952 stop:8403 length:1452 start_codon:yes stop_codon:yes gene_type:complete
MKLYALSIGFVLGIFYTILSGASIFFLLFLSVPALLFFGYGAIKKVSKVLLIGLLFLGFMLGGFRALSELVPQTALDSFLQKEFSIQGKIVEEVDIRETHTRFIVENEEVRVLVTTERFVPIAFGDVVTATGMLSKPEAFKTDTGRIFAYDKFLAKDNIHYVVSFADVEVVEKGDVSIRGFLFAVKDFFLRNIMQALPEPQSALGGGITVGAKRSLGDELLDAFVVTGLIHIVVLSGYNVTIIAEAIMRSLKFLPKRVALSIGAGSIGLFVFMVGAGATIVRAGIMAVLALIARATGRTYALTRALLVAGMFMLILNPLILVYDPSFQLSFIATLGLIYVAPLIESYIPWVTKKFGLREIVGATIGTQIAVFPLLLYLTGLLSLSSLPANVLVLPIIPIAMLFSLIAGVFGAIPGIGVLFGLPAYLTLSYVLVLVDFIAAIPGSAVTLPVFPFWVTLLMYIFIVWFLWRKGGRDDTLSQRKPQ